MFTGIVESIGQVLGRTDETDSATLQVTAPGIRDGLRHGDSVAVAGVCLTVTTLTEEAITFDVMAETLNRSTMGALHPGDPVNLERAMAANGRFGGHIVQGHVDGVGVVTSRVDGERWRTLRFEIPSALARFLVEKGSITVSGTSLTVSAVSDPGDGPAWFEVGLIPTTLELTTLGAADIGTRVNLEVDVLAKYLERGLAFDRLAAGQEAS